MSHDLHATSSAAFFEAKYQEDPDPWGFAGNGYELHRYAAIIRAIAHRHYARAFEPGCSIGVLTERLAAYCDEVYAIDFSRSAVTQAQARCAHLPQVEVHCAALALGTTAEEFDLLVLSEIGYYFARHEWQRISSALIDSLAPGATVLGAHWLGHSQDHRISGDEVNDILLAHPKLRVEHRERHPDVRLDRLVRL